MLLNTMVKPIAGEVLETKRLRHLTLTETLYPENLFLAKHSHAVTYLTLVIDGTYQERFGRTTNICRPQSLRCLPADEPHSNDYPSGAHCLHIGIEASLVAHVKEVSAVVADAKMLNGGLAEWLGTRLYREFRQADDIAPLAVEGLVLELLAEGLRRGKANDRGRIPPWLRAANDMLRANFASRPTLSEVARAVGVHPVHLCREFRRHHQMTIGDFLRRLRIDHARRLLMNTHDPLSDIALACGFADQSHFSATFKRLVGTTPAKYRHLST